ncbi:MAG: hypothetical protein AABX10_01695 [Nanoarchaeota archaeon]
MKIIKVSSRSVLNKDGKKIKYDKFLINLPKKIVDESGLLGKNIKAEIKNMKIIIGVDNQ